MPTAVISGAGNIGRGFLGQILAESGWAIVFIEAQAALVKALNQEGRYPVQIVANEASREYWVEGVRAVAAGGREAAEELARADLAATAVGVNMLPRVAPTIAAALILRAQARAESPLDLIVCENQLHADRLLREEVARNMPPGEGGLLDRLGLIEASIGRMVPVVTPERRAADPLRVWVEPYCELPVDAAGFRGTVPSVKYLLPRSPFDYYIQRKLFLHNAGHALAAYLGNLRGHEFIWQSMADAGIAARVRSAMAENVRALSLEHGVPPDETRSHAEDLQERFANRALGDTVARVGRDPYRKLGPEDRLVGAARLVLKHDGDPSGMALGIAAALRFKPADDEGAARVQAILTAGGVDAVLAEVCGLKPGEPLAEMVKRAYASNRTCGFLKSCEKPI